MLDQIKKVFWSLLNVTQMLVHAVAVLALGAVVLGDVGAPLDLVLAPKCKPVNDAIDQYLVDSNYDMKDQGADQMWADYYGFQQDLNLYAFGHKLPTKVSLSVFNGTLNNLNTLTRVGDSTSCSIDSLTPISTTLEGKYTYGSGLNLTYELLTAKFLFWEVHGSLTFKPQLVVHVAFFNDSFETCRLESFELVRQDQSDYIISTDDTWTGWLVGKIVRHALLQEDSTPLFTTVLQFAQGYIDSSFREAWCNLWSPDIH